MTTLDNREQQTLTKRCTKCGEVKALEEFSPRKDRRGGRRSQCRVCRAKHEREARWVKKGIPESEWPLLHREADRQQRMRELAARHGLKYCSGCNMCLGRGFFNRRSATADGRRAFCKACDSAYNAAYYRTEAGRASRKGGVHRYRARLRELPTDGTGPRDWAAFAEEIEDFECHLCGGTLTAEDEIHWDHVEAISNGSAGTVLHNMHAAHAWCNRSRGNRPIEEWRAAMGLSDEIP